MSRVNRENIQEIMSVLCPTINKYDNLVLERYNEYLEKFIYGIARYRLIERKKKFSITVVDLYSELRASFFTASGIDNYRAISKVIDEFYDFVNDNGEKELISKDKITEEVNELFKGYCYAYEIDEERATRLFNELLNKRDDNFIKREIPKIRLEIKSKLELTPKKESDLLLTKQILLVIEDMRLQKIDLTSITNDLDNIMARINGIQKMRQEGVVISPEVFLHWRDLFLKGELELRHIKEDLPVSMQAKNKDIEKEIFNKYIQLLIPLAKKIKVTYTKEELQNYKYSLDLNYHNFLVVSEKMYNTWYNSIENFLLTQENFNLSAKELSDLACFVPFINLTKDFTLEQFLNIFLFYKRALKKISNDKKTIDIINNFADVILYTNSINMKEDIDEAILGRDVLKKVPDYLVHDYAQMYLKMYQKRSSFIPNVRMEYGNYVLENDNYIDPERLLVGRNCKGSCIDISNNAGVKTYEKVLTEKDGAVLWIKDKSTNQFVCRSLMFRRGNVLMLAPFYKSDGGICEELAYNYDFLYKLGNSILNEASKAHDNLSYVLLSNYHNHQKTSFNVVNNTHFATFPHADIDTSASILASTRLDSEGMDFLLEPKISYMINRPSIPVYSPLDNIKRLEAINICLEKDKKRKQELTNNFLLLDELKINNMIASDDYYILKTEDGITLERIFPSYDARCLNEYFLAKDRMISEEEIRKR